ncbi:MAG: hypothetical protein HQK50_03920 [Oligoflexia bacterium]|nr:hypothetical protein [Oligoflexia bacterium]
MKLFLVVWSPWRYRYTKEPVYGIISLHSNKDQADHMLKRILNTQGNDDAWVISDDEVCYKPAVVYKILTLGVDEIYKDFHLFDRD